MRGKMESGRLIYMNGDYVSEKDAKISIFDSALMFGDMVFEMTRSFNKKQFKLREHLERLYAGIKILQIPINMSIDEMEQTCYQTIEKNEPVFEDHDEHRLMINVSRGPLGIYAPIFDGKLQPTVVIADFPLKWTIAYMGGLFDTGINAVITSQRAIPASLLEPKIKNRSRMHLQMANIEASNWKGKPEENWALMLDPDGFVAEGTGDNFFIVKNGIVITPEGRNILRGISREYIFELCQQMQIQCIEKNIEVYDVNTADEAFMTGTPFCLLPVTKLNGEAIGEEKMGTITTSLIEKWSENVGLDIIQQMRDYGDECSSPAGDAPTPYQFKKIKK
jgi:branched-chain amino acid aminotransferase